MHVVVVFYVQSHEYRIAESLVVGMKKARISKRRKGSEGWNWRLVRFCKWPDDVRLGAGRKCWRFRELFSAEANVWEICWQEIQARFTYSDSFKEGFLRKGDLLERNFAFSQNAKRRQGPQIKAYFCASRKTLNCAQDAMPFGFKPSKLFNQNL